MKAGATRQNVIAVRAAVLISSYTSSKTAHNERVKSSSPVRITCPTRTTVAHLPHTSDKISRSGLDKVSLTGERVSMGPSEAMKIKSVVPAKAGTHCGSRMASRLRGDDVHEVIFRRAKRGISL